MYSFHSIFNVSLVLLSGLKWGPVVLGPNSRLQSTIRYRARTLLQWGTVSWEGDRDRTQHSFRSVPGFTRLVDLEQPYVHCLFG